MKQCYESRLVIQWQATVFVTNAGLNRVSTLLVVLWLGIILGVQAQQRTPQFFQPDKAAHAAAAASPLAAALFRSQALTLDMASLRAVLATAPSENQIGAVPVVLDLPLPDGTTGRCRPR